MVCYRLSSLSPNQFVTVRHFKVDQYPASAGLANSNDTCIRSRVAQAREMEVIVKHDVGFFERAHDLERKELRVTRPRAD